MEDKTFENIAQKSRWQVWKEAPWFSWYRSRLTNVRKSRKQFIPMKWHFRFGRCENVDLFPCYKGNLAKVFDFFQWDVTWKSKFDSPRFEYNPMISIVFFWTWRFYFWYGFTPEQHREGYIEDEYWEQYLWTVHWSDGDVGQARETWEWRDRSGNSTWKDKYIKTDRT